MYTFLSKARVWVRTQLKKIIYLESKRNAPVKYSGAVRILEIEYGHLNSKKTAQAIDSSNIEIPWFTYPAIEYLDQLDLSDKRMLEWGAGNSSVFFGKRVKFLYSVENDSMWYDIVRQRRIPNQKLIKATEEEYAFAPLDLKAKFDIILIDGINREGCSEIALCVLNEGGIIIFDNCDRYPEIARKLRDENLIQVDFHGFGPINEYTWTTSIFFSRKFSFMPISKQPRIPIGGGF